MAFSSFTQFLLQNDYASLSELEEASQASVLYGGRLGTAMIELGLLSPEQLDTALARHLGLPEIPTAWLAKPDAAARAALHIDLVKRHRAFPLQFEKRTLHVGLLDPRDDAVLDELAFASGCLIAPYVLAEFRFVQLMQRVYSIAPSSRFKTLLDEGARALARRLRAAQRKSIEDERARVIPELEIGPLAADVELSQSDAFFRVAEPIAVPAPVAPAAPVSARTPAVAALAAPTAKASAPAAAKEPALEIDDDEPILLDRRAPTLPQASIAALEGVLAESPDRSCVIDASVELASRFAEAAALFVIRDGVAAGLGALRGGKPLEVDATVIPLAADNALAACVANRQQVRTNPSTALDKLLAKALRSGEHTQLAVYPIQIGERVVNLLVAQAQHGALGATADAALAALARLIGGAYERLIREHKQRTIPLPPASPAVATAREAAPKATAAIGALPLLKRVVRAPAKN